MERAAKELVVNRLTVLDWASDRAAERVDEPDAESSVATPDGGAWECPGWGRRAAA
jgi:hypothetical protein